MEVVTREGQLHRDLLGGRRPRVPGVPAAPATAHRPRLRGRGRRGLVAEVEVAARGVAGVLAGAADVAAVPAAAAAAPVLGEL